MGLLLERLGEATLLKTAPWNHPYLSCSLILENIHIIFTIKTSGWKMFLCCVTLQQQLHWYKSGVFFLEFGLTGHSLSAPQQTHLTLFQLNPMSRAHQAETLDRTVAHLWQHKMCAAELKVWIKFHFLFAQHPQASSGLTPSPQGARQSLLSLLSSALWWVLWQSQLLPSYWRHLVSQQRGGEAGCRGSHACRAVAMVTTIKLLFLVGMGTIRILTFPPRLPVPNQRQPDCLPHSIHKCNYKCV